MCREKVKHLRVFYRFCASFRDLLLQVGGGYGINGFCKRDEGENSVHVSPQRGPAEGCKPPAKTPLGSLRSGCEEMRGRFAPVTGFECARTPCEQGWYRGIVFRPLSQGTEVFFVKETIA